MSIALALEAKTREPIGLLVGVERNVVCDEDGRPKLFAAPAGQLDEEAGHGEWRFIDPVVPNSRRDQVPIKVRHGKRDSIAEVFVPPDRVDFVRDLIARG